jgi:hypothetical protein
MIAGDYIKKIIPSHHEVHEDHEEIYELILLPSELRVLRDLRGENSVYFGCGFAALGASWLMATIVADGPS